MLCLAVVPPGYYVKEIDAATNNYTMAKCPRNVDNVGYYRDGWVSPKQVIDKDGTKACKGCGKNILSAYVDRDEIEDVFTLLQTEEPRGFVAATSAACCKFKVQKDRALCITPKLHMNSFVIYYMSQRVV